MLQDLKVATLFLTRIPVRVEGSLSMRDLAAAVHLFPLIGALVGLLGGLAFWLAHRIGLPAIPCAILAILATVAATGALHEDGLADTADGLGAGPDRSRALEIMRDSRIGSYGTIALVLSLLARVSALASFGAPAAVLPVLIAGGAVSRALMPLVMLLQPSARASGLAAEAGRPEPVRVALAGVAAVALAFLILPAQLAAGSIVAAVLVGLLVAGHLGRRLGGCTGDTLGAVQQLAELAFLYGMLARL